MEIDRKLVDPLKENTATGMSFLKKKGYKLTFEQYMEHLAVAVQEKVEEWK